MTHLLGGLIGRTRRQRSVYLAGGAITTIIGVLSMKRFNETDLARYQRAAVAIGGGQFYVPKSPARGGLEWLGGWTALCGIVRWLRRRRTA